MQLEREMAEQLNRYALFYPCNSLTQLLRLERR